MKNPPTPRWRVKGRGLGREIMSNSRGLELAALFALALIASLTAWEFDYQIFGAIFATAAAVAAFENARSQ
jgi:hypothetical protein